MVTPRKWRVPKTNWGTPESAGIRGFFNLAADTPEYQAEFRNRFIKEQLLAFLQTWAERQQDEAQFQAYRAARKLVEAVMNTMVVVEFAVLNRNLDAPRKGTAEICVRTQLEARRHAFAITPTRFPPGIRRPDLRGGAARARPQRPD